MSKDRNVPLGIGLLGGNAKVYNTIAEMQKDSKLKVGKVVEVLGYYQAGDGAGHKRVIADSDDGSGVQLVNGLWANIVTNSKGKDKLYKADTLEELKQLKYLQVGDIVEIFGYYTKGDGYTHTRIISSTNDGTGVQISENKWANILYAKSTFTSKKPKYLHSIVKLPLKKPQNYLERSLNDYENCHFIKDNYIYIVYYPASSATDKTDYVLRFKMDTPDGIFERDKNYLQIMPCSHTGTIFLDKETNFLYAVGETDGVRGYFKINLEDFVSEKLSLSNSYGRGLVKYRNHYYTLGYGKFYKFDESFNKLDELIIPGEFDNLFQDCCIRGNEYLAIGSYGELDTDDNDSKIGVINLDTFTVVGITNIACGNGYVEPEGIDVNDDGDLVITSHYQPTTRGVRTIQAWVDILSLDSVGGYSTFKNIRNRTWEITVGNDLSKYDFNELLDAISYALQLRETADLYKYTDVDAFEIIISIAEDIQFKKPVVLFGKDLTGIYIQGKDAMRTISFSSFATFDSNPAEIILYNCSSVTLFEKLKFNQRLLIYSCPCIEFTNSVDLSECNFLSWFSYIKLLARAEWLPIYSNYNIIDKAFGNVVIARHYTNPVQLNTPYHIELMEQEGGTTKQDFYNYLGEKFAYDNQVKEEEKAKYEAYELLLKDNPNLTWEEFEQQYGNNVMINLSLVERLEEPVIPESVVKFMEKYLGTTPKVETKSTPKIFSYDEVDKLNDTLKKL